MDKSLKEMIAAGLLAALLTAPVFGAEPTSGIFERLIPISDIDKVRFEKELEDRLSRDIGAYLGHDRYIVRANAELEKRERVQQTVVREAAPEASARKSEQPSSPGTQSLFKEMEITTEDGIGGSDAATGGDPLTLPGLPVPEGAAKARAESNRASSETQKKIIKREFSEVAEGAPEERVRERVQTEVLDSRVVIRKLLLKLVLDETISAEEERFIRDLVKEKTDFSTMRGDELKVVRTAFPGAPADGEEPATEEKDRPAGERMWWQKLEPYWPYILGGALILLLLLLWAMIRRSRGREAEVPAAAPTAPEPRADEPLPEPSSDLPIRTKLQVVKEALVSITVNDPKVVKEHVKGLAQTEQPGAQAAVESLYREFGEGLFRGLFSDVLSGDYLLDVGQRAREDEEEPADPEKRLAILERLYHDLLQARAQKAGAGRGDEKRPFTFLEELDDSQILYLLHDEESKIKALTLSQLPADRSAALLNRIEPNERTAIAMEISRFHSLPVGSFRDVANRLAKKAIGVPSFHNISMDGVDLLISMLDHMDTGNETALLNTLRDENPELYHRIKRIYITFDDIVRMPRLALKNLVREMERDVLATALYDTDEAFRDAIFEVLLDRPRAMLKSAIDHMGQPGDGELQEAKREVSRRAREMLKAGAFEMPDEPAQPGSAASA